VPKNKKGQNKSGLSINKQAPLRKLRTAKMVKFKNKRYYFNNKPKLIGYLILVKKKLTQPQQK